MTFIALPGKWKNMEYRVLRTGPTGSPEIRRLNVRDTKKSFWFLFLEIFVFFRLLSSAKLISPRQWSNKLYTSFLEYKDFSRIPKKYIYALIIASTLSRVRLRCWTSKNADNENNSMITITISYKYFNWK